MRQIWFCERCKQVGAVRLDDGELALDVIYALNQDHRRTSPTCPNPISFLRVLSAGWLLDKAEIPMWAAQEVRRLLDI